MISVKFLKPVILLILLLSPCVFKASILNLLVCDIFGLPNNLSILLNISETFNISKSQGLWITVIAIGSLGAIYAFFGGLKAVAISDTINGYGLLIGGTAIPLIAIFSIGDGNIIEGLMKVYNNNPEKFNVIGTRDSVMPFEVLFTGLIINQIYF